MEIRRLFVWSLISLISGLVSCNLCPSSDDESVLHANNIYTYRFRSEALALAVGTTEDHGKIALECDVHITHDTTCFYNLDLHNCVVTATGGEPESQTPWIDQQPLPDLSKYPVSFSLSNGEIKEVRTHKEDPLYYVNIKRGVLSAFVFKLSQTKEKIKEEHTDVHGTCPLTSKPALNDEETVKTSKDMLHCKFPSRPDWQFSPWSMFWNMSFIQHVINSTTDCEYKINEQGKRIEKVFCKERHAIMLESTRRTTTAVQTVVYYYLDFVKLEMLTSKPAFPTLNRKTDIRFEYEHTPSPQSSPRNFLAVAKKMLSDLVQDSVDEIRLFTIPQFTDFVAWIRSSHNLRPLVDSVKACSFLPDGVQCDQIIKDLAYSYLSDALLQCNNVPCAKTLTYLVMNDNLSPTYLNFIFQSWSYMHYSKPGFITNFVDMCKLKNSHQCWMALGSFVRRVSSEDIDNKVLQEVTEVASYFYDHIVEECDVTDDTDKVYTECLIFLKAANNMGKYYNKIAPHGLSQMLDLATDEYLPTVVRTSALEALKDIYDANNFDQESVIYDRLLPLMKNETLAASVRILAYDQLIHVSSEYNFDEHLFYILKEDKNPEVKSYVAHSVNSMMTDSEFKHMQFVTSLDNMLYENDLSLEKIIYDTKGKSKPSEYSAFLNFDFLPDNMKRFGMKLSESFIYDSRVYPTIFNQKSLFQLFSQFLPATKMSSYAEGWEGLLLAYRKNLVDMNDHPISFAKISQALMKTLGEYGLVDEDSLRNFDENILSNLNELHQIYWKHHNKVNPYAKAYLDLFGSTMKYFVEDSFRTSAGNPGIAKLIHSVGKSLAEGANFNANRVIRIIEAYHQVPTMMGLPLNWTTNATLAFSFRAGMKLQFHREDGHIQAKGHFQPSAALTFLNRMVLDFPTVTQIGVQANSSGYTSTEFKGQFNSAKGKHSLRFDRPSKTQKILELFRTNQLIKHNNYKDIPDWDIERTSSSWCSSDDSPVGLKVCLSKSYPNVTHLIKPWALMAGWCKWQFLVHPTNENEMHYDLEFQQALKQRGKEWTAKFTASENDKEKSASFNALVDDNGKDMKVELTTTLVPDFSASFTKSDTSSKKVCGQKIEAILNLSKDSKYELEYSSEGKVQKSSSPANSPPDENNQKLLSDDHLVLKTPYSVYEWKKSLLKIGENTKAEATVSYENYNYESDWMKGILPPAFWETDKKAFFKILLHWKKPIHNSQGTVTRQTEFRLQVPLYVMSLNGKSLNSRGRSQYIVNLAKVDNNKKKLDAFLDYTFDYWSNESKDTGTVNITISRRSWSATFESASEERINFRHGLTLKRAVMKPLNDMQSDYVGWWSDEVSDSFRVEEQEIKVVAKHDRLFETGKELANRFSSVSFEDVAGLSNSVCTSNIAIHYPFNGRTETVVFDGFFMFSMGGSTYRFQNTFDITSSYHNLKVSPNTVFRMDKEATTLYHNAQFTHLTSDSKAYHTIHLVWLDKKRRCSDIEFNHDIRSQFFDLSTEATYRCESEKEGLHTLRLQINSNSSKWNMLDMKLDQIIEDVSPDYTREEMTTTHALGTIHVDAEWHSHPRHHKKLVTFCRKDGNCPAAELSLDIRFGDRSYKFSRPEYEITYRRRMSSDYKKMHIEVGYGHKEEGEFPVLDFTGELVARNYHVWKGTVHTDSFNKVKDVFVSAYDTARDAIVEVAQDKDHPLNEMLQPALKMTLYDYWESLKAQYQEFFFLSWSEIKEIFYTIDAFTEPAYTVLMNSFSSFRRACVSAYNILKERTVTIWAIDYFNVPYYFEKGLTSLPQAVTDLWNQLALGKDKVLHFKFVTGKIFAMKSFLDWPSVDFTPEDLRGLFSFNPKSISGLKRNKDAKVAVIFGPTHVYTFDGHLYDVPAFPDSECSFLLAHDVHKSMFTAFTTEKGIHLLFPEMSVSINEENEVFVNNSKDPSALPIQSSNGKVTVKRGQLVEVWSPSLSVVCRSEDFLCLLTLSDYHAGGVIGLLGNADGDSTNDMILPSGKTASLLDFVKSYEVSGKPECQNLETSSLVLPPSIEEFQICSNAFGEICSSQTDVRDQFWPVCISDVKEGRGACYSTAGLSALCSMKYAASQTDCNVIKQETEKIDKKLEVVLVVQETKYLTSSDKSSSPLKGIENLIKAVESKFTEAGYSSVKYSLVGFGGNGVHYAPTVHSSQKNIWLDADDMINVLLKTLEFKSKEEADSVQALKFALKELGHDSFDSKVFIVVTPKDKQVADKSLMSFIQTHLEENGITLYTLSSYPSIEKGKKVFGVRADGLIFPSQTDGGDTYLDYPRGNLAKLTSSTRGSVFLVKFLKDNKPPAFFTEFAQEVWSKVNAEAKKCRSCKSVRSEWWWYRNECSIVRCF